MNCKYFDTCSAPLCPLDSDSLKYGIWYPDEEICKSRKFATNKIIRTQKKIIKKTTDSNDGYFTADMLKSIHTVRSGIKGLDPNREERFQLKKWQRILV